MSDLPMWDGQSECYPGDVYLTTPELGVPSHTMLMLEEMLCIIQIEKLHRVTSEEHPEGEFFVARGIYVRPEDMGIIRDIGTFKNPSISVGLREMASRQVHYFTFDFQDFKKAQAFARDLAGFCKVREA